MTRAACSLLLPARTRNEKRYFDPARFRIPCERAAVELHWIITDLQCRAVAWQLRNNQRQSLLKWLTAAVSYMQDVYRFVLNRE